jgi:hypothetical protein
MAGIQRLLAIATAFSMTSIPGRGAPAALGVIVQADRASLGTLAATEGTTIFDGDRVSTGDGGSLRMVLGEAMLYLGEQSRVTVRNDGSTAEKHFEAELESGAVVLSTAAGRNGEIVASAARVRPAAEARGVVQVRLAAAHELIVYAQRGPAEICYRGECETIPEGKSYRVVLNAADAGPSGAPSAISSGKALKTFVLIAVGVGIAAGIASMLSHGQSAQGGQKGIESPDHP